MIGAGNVTRNCKGDHAVATGRSDTRTLARKRFNGLVKSIARTVGLILGLTLKFEFYVAAFDVVFQSLFEFIEVVFEAISDGRRRHKGASKRNHAEAARFACITTIIISNRCQPTRSPFLIDGAFGSIMQVCSAVIVAYRPCSIGVKLGRPHLVWDTRQ